MQTSSSKAARRNLFILPMLTTALVAALVAIAGMAAWLFAQDRPVAKAETVREYTLEIGKKDISYGNGAVWHAWTYNGQVPGTTLRVKLGERLRVRVVNKTDIEHSFHTHLTNYPFSQDGSQANLVGQVGHMSMIEPDREYTFEFQPTTAGIYFYHCHSASGNLPISQHIEQGLYGAIIVEAPDEPPMRQEVLFMAESGFDKTGNVPPFVMNGLGLPGGEHTLEKVYAEQGFAGVAAQLGVTLPFFETRVNEPIKLHVINMGNLDHTFHAHSATLTSLGVLGGRQWPANTLPLLPGTADTVVVNFSQPGLWLFHCHVVTHADAGMLGVFIVKDEKGNLPGADASGGSH